MSAHGLALRALGALTVAYSVGMAWPSVALIRASSDISAVMSATAIGVADPATREALAREGISQELLADELAGRYRREVLTEQAPALVRSVLGVVAGLLLVLRRRSGRLLLVAFVLWPFAARAYHEARLALSPVKLQFLSDYNLPLAQRVVRLELLGRTWEVDADALWLGAQMTFTAVALGILAWAFLAERRKGARA